MTISHRDAYAAIRTSNLNNTTQIKGQSNGAKHWFTIGEYTEIANNE